MEKAPVQTAERTSGFARVAPQPEPQRAQDCRLRQLVLQHYDFIWRTLRRLGVPPADVDDAAQEVFMVTSRRLEDVEPSSERSFLFGTAVRVASTWRRNVSRRREDAEAVLDHRQDPNPDPEEIMDRQRCREALQRILLEMSFEHRAVFVLFELEQLPIGEIAELLSVPTGTVASRLRRAREIFLASAKRFQARQAFAEKNHD